MFKIWQRLGLIRDFVSVEKCIIIGEKKMRIEKIKEKFCPVTITLESPEELMFMWYRMNAGSSAIFEHVTGAVPHNTNTDHSYSLKIYRELDEELTRLGLKR